ncbi:nascent polypeptide-associated complex subunit alpha, muscle-specific form-like [Macaca nemestrina]|uniref:nascent polypeptide-associated complex subunit alpha, muscle-specific form-like n=1 Tax=Macaca nemestrina TaxID=9545 RepID=UPI0039B837E3
MQGSQPPATANKVTTQGCFSHPARWSPGPRRLMSLTLSIGGQTPSDEVRRAAQTPGPPLRSPQPGGANRTTAASAGRGTGYLKAVGSPLASPWRLSWLPSRVIHHPPQANWRGGWKGFARGSKSPGPSRKDKLWGQEAPQPPTQDWQELGARNSPHGVPASPPSKGRPRELPAHPHQPLPSPGPCLAHRGQSSPHREPAPNCRPLPPSAAAGSTRSHPAARAPKPSTGGASPESTSPRAAQGLSQPPSEQPGIQKVPGSARARHIGFTSHGPLHALRVRRRKKTQEMQTVERDQPPPAWSRGPVGTGSGPTEPAWVAHTIYVRDKSLRAPRKAPSHGKEGLDAGEAVCRWHGSMTCPAGGGAPGQ